MTFPPPAGGRTKENFRKYLSKLLVGEQPTYLLPRFTKLKWTIGTTPFDALYRTSIFKRQKWGSHTRTRLKWSLSQNRLSLGGPRGLILHRGNDYWLWSRLNEQLNRVSEQKEVFTCLLKSIGTERNSAAMTRKSSHVRLSILPERS